MRKTVSLLVVLCLVLLTFGAACTSSPADQTATPTPVTTQPTKAVVPTATQVVDLEPKPTDVVPTQKMVTVDVDKDPIYGTITVTFRGGKGQYAVTKLTAKATLATGEIITKDLPPEVNAEAEFPGTTGSDRIEVTAYYNDGTSYRIYDKLSEIKRQ
ncbi:MAG: hypothetical protein GKC04_02360 [Methanomicrobiales archaeon]|nr:hypothetical protein [Methanomicrobiales archaeon]